MLTTLHLGRGTTRGPLTVFPLWGEGSRAADYVTTTDDIQVTELPAGAQVNTLLVTNSQTSPLLLVAGELLEGGQQHRMVADTVLVPARSNTPVSVVCVEHGRWSGGERHRAAGRRASARLRAGLRPAVVAGSQPAPGRQPDRQSEVWSRIARLEGHRGRSSTQSYLDYADQSQAWVSALTHGLRPFPGQVGVMIGIAGHPVSVEVFDRPEALTRQFDSIIRAAAFDAIDRPAIPTPSERGRRFLELAAEVPLRPAGEAGIGRRRTGADAKVEVDLLDWMDHSIHALLSNPRHQVLQAA